MRSPAPPPIESAPTTSIDTSSDETVDPAPTDEAAFMTAAAAVVLVDDEGDWLLAPEDAFAESEAAAAPRVGIDDWTMPDDDTIFDGGVYDATDVDGDAEDWLQPPPTSAPLLTPIPLPNAVQQRSQVFRSVSNDRHWDESDFHDELARFTTVRSEAERAIAEEVEQSSRLAWSEPTPDEEPENEPNGAAEAKLAEPSFVVQARRQAFWRSPAMRGVLFAMAMLLMVLLLAQWAVQERDRLAARYPASLPVLRWLCQPMQCDLAAPRRIDAVVIDSSNLVRRLGNFYAFDFVLKNSEPMAVAMPALELSLTDVAGTIITRRVFLPHELPGTPVVVPAQGTMAVSLRLSLSESGIGAMTGYRALVFYP